MAVLTKGPELGGYDYDFITRVPEDWICLVCHLAMKDPVQIVGCGHRLCNICMESLFRRPSPSCPADRQPLSRDKIFPDAACHRKILDLSVKCSYFRCSWTGELRDVEKHQSSCSFKVVNCPNIGCKEKLTKQELTIHVTFECSWRIIKCEYCTASFVQNQKQIHLATCTKFPVQCTNKCGVRDIPREMFPRSSATFHSESQVEHHLTLALRGLESTQHQVRALANLVKEQSQQIKRLEQMTEKYAPYIWKITGFQAVYDRAVTGEQETLLSEPFYLSKNGYKLRIKMLPNGGTADPPSHKKFHGKYLSVYIKVIPGDYDSILLWPFTEKIRITIIDQASCQGDRVNISMVVDFKDSPWPRPLKEGNLGFGYPGFVPQNELQTRSYLKNDKIFLMASRG
ncbi:TNF receptor-associated factor 4-like isoform X2 [Porites lutea]|uniref:TNF receptor-associated factor 4-like isoform X2 n=1 Tax=Porites lutea TaxID=51062 RepID=UPI003CC69D5E